jgi:hypothetical protein
MKTKSIIFLIVFCFCGLKRLACDFLQTFKYLNLT